MRLPCVVFLIPLVLLGMLCISYLQPRAVPTQRFTGVFLPQSIMETEIADLFDSKYHFNLNAGVSQLRGLYHSEWQALQAYMPDCTLHWVVREAGLWCVSYYIAVRAETKPQTKNTEPVQRLFHVRVAASISVTEMFFSASRMVHFITPLYGRKDTFNRFAQHMQKLFKVDKSFRIVLVDCGNDENFTSTIAQMAAGQPVTRLIWNCNQNFSRNAALQIGVDHLRDEDLMFMLDIDMLIGIECLGRLRRLVRPGVAFAPVCFSLYENSKAISRSDGGVGWTISKNSGYWRTTGWGMIGLYRRDAARAGGYNLQTWGWGGEDVTFANRLLRTRVQIIRSLEPALVHVWHPKNCTGAVDFVMCKSVEMSSWRSQHDLAMYLEETLRRASSISPSLLRIEND